MFRVSVLFLICPYLTPMKCHTWSGHRRAQFSKLEVGIKRKAQSHTSFIAIVSLSKRGVAFVYLRLSKGGVASWFLSPSDGGVASLSISLNKTACPVSGLGKEAWPRCLSVLPFIL